MKSSITEFVKEVTNKIINVLEGADAFADKEQKILSELKSCSTDIIKMYIEHIDQSILSDLKSRKESGHVVERRGDIRRLNTLLGEVSYRRAYYKKASGGYEYLTDTAMGFSKNIKISTGVADALVNTAIDLSYQKTAETVCGGLVTKQTVKNVIRGSKAVGEAAGKRMKVPVLHIDADEAHTPMQRGKNCIVPLISIYEGIERKGKRGICKNVFHVSAHGLSPDGLWEKALDEAEKRYDLSETKFYIHGDGGGWIKTGLEWFPRAIMVLDKYHKNKAIKAMLAGMEREDRKDYDRRIREALAYGNRKEFIRLTNRLYRQMPERKEKISSSAKYLRNHIEAIAICTTDPEANNGGCTEPHVSHVLANRLTSRPKGWSKKTLRAFAPILASGKAKYKKEARQACLPHELERTVKTAKQNFKSSYGLGLPSPEAIGRVPIDGHNCGTQYLLRNICTVF